MMRLSRSPLLVLLSALLLIVLIRTAWVSDDAYITFRTIDNFNHGFGLRWNVDERVQTYTHPLWMLLLIVLSRFAPLYYGTIVLSIGLTMAAIALLATRVAHSHESALVAVTILVFSRAFTDFSTSGLENPLTHLLLSLLFWLYLSEASDRPRRIALGLVAGLAVLNRLDIALLIGPAVAVTWTRDRRHVVASAMAALIPVAIWEVFAIVYYGFPLPNTVYAKLQTGIPAMELAAHGLTYLRDSLASDPITLTTIALVAVLGAVVRGGRNWPVLLGVGLYLAGLTRAGGDFMSGRMLATPLFCTVVLLARFEWIAGERRALVLCAIATVLGLVAPRPTIWSNALDSDTRIASSGIADERRFYQPSTGLLSATWRGEYPSPYEQEERAQARRAGRRSPVVTQIGMQGYWAGPAVHVIDPLGLGDPLLARLPAAAGWRIGHYRRDLPAGYEDSIERGINAIQDSAIAAYYERLRIITRDPIWSRRRARVILRANLGGYILK